MAVTFETFQIKYGSRLPTLTEAQFAAFLPDALVEIDRFQWGTLRDRATEMLIGHLLELAGGGSAVSQAIASVKIEDEVSIGYADSSKLSGYQVTWFGREYERLLKLLGDPTRPATTHYSGVRTNIIPPSWG